MARETELRSLDVVPTHRISEFPELVGVTEAIERSATNAHRTQGWIILWGRCQLPISK